MSKEGKSQNGDSSVLLSGIKGKAILLHQLEQGISNHSALRGEIIKRDEGVMERESGSKIQTASKQRATLLRHNYCPK
jgi:hypothetical protein